MRDKSWDGVCIDFWDKVEIEFECNKCHKTKRKIYKIGGHSLTDAQMYERLLIQGRNITNEEHVCVNGKTEKIMGYLRVIKHMTDHEQYEEWKKIVADGMTVDEYYGRK